MPHPLATSDLSVAPRRAVLRAALRASVSVGAIAAVFGAGGLASPALAWGSRESVTGSGRRTTETRALTGYDGIALRGNFKVTLRANGPSGREGVELHGDDNLLPLIETRLVDSRGAEGRTLELRWRDGVSVSAREPIEVIVDVRSLRAVSVSGSGSVVGDGLKTPTLNLALAGSGDIALAQLQADECSLKLSGSGDVRLAGRAQRLSISVAGSGDVDALELEAATASVNVAGSGDVKVNASQSLAVSIAGSGDVSHRGAAQPQVSVAGSGTVRRL